MDTPVLIANFCVQVQHEIHGLKETINRTMEMGTDKKELGKEVAATYQVTNKPLIPGTTRSEQR